MSAISSTTAGAPAAGSTDAFAALKSEDFIGIIFAELTNQDPLSPSETKDLLEQITLISQIESDEDFSKKLDSLVRQNEVTSASSLIGKLATGLNTSNTRVVGYVDSISVSDDGTVLNLNTGDRLPFDRVDEIIDPSLFDDNGDGPTPGDSVDDPTDDPPADDTGDDTPEDDTPGSDG